MKTSILAFFLFYNTISYSQIDYNHFFQSWSKCLPDSAASDSDTLRFMSKEFADECKTSWQSESLIHHENLRYAFFINDSMTIYGDSGYRIRPDYVADTMTTIVVQRDTIVSASGQQTIVVTENVIKVPVQFGPGGSAARMAQSYYRLNPKIHQLTVIDEGEIEYEILYLSERELVLLLK